MYVSERISFLIVNEVELKLNVFFFIQKTFHKYGKKFVKLILMQCCHMYDNYTQMHGNFYGDRQTKQFLIK